MASCDLLDQRILVTVCIHQIMGDELGTRNALGPSVSQLQVKAVVSVKGVQKINHSLQPPGTTHFMHCFPPFGQPARVRSCMTKVKQRDD